MICKIDIFVGNRLNSLEDIPASVEVVEIDLDNLTGCAEPHDGFLVIGLGEFLFGCCIHLLCQKKLEKIYM